MLAINDDDAVKMDAEVDVDLADALEGLGVAGNGAGSRSCDMCRAP